MQAVLSQIDALATTLIEEKRKSRRNLYLLGGAYAGLIIWTIWDTGHVLQQIKTVSAPEQVAAMAANQVSQQLPALQQDMVAHFQKSAPQLADKLLSSAHQAIPATGKQIKLQLSAAADQLSQRMNQQTPEISRLLKEQLKPTLSAAQYASDAELSKALVSETLKALDQQLQLALAPSNFGSLLTLKSEIDHLAKPSTELTPQQRVEKAAILNAMRLSELARGGGNSSLLAQGVRAILQASLPPDMFKALDSPVSP